MSPRKSSTSSGRSSARRPRYLGVEVAGEHLPPVSPRAWERLLASRLGSLEGPVPSFRVVRADGRRAVAEVDHSSIGRVRAAWNAPAPDGPSLATRRTWGTLVGAKRWLQRPALPGSREPPGSGRRPRGDRYPRPPLS